MPLARYITFKTQSVFTSETFDVDPDDHVVDPLGEDITGDKQFLYPRTAGVRVGRAKVKGKNKWSGSFDMPLYPVGSTSLLYYTMGNVVTTPATPNTNVNTHLIKQANTVPFFQCAIGREIREHQYVGGFCNAMTIDYTMDDVITSSFDVMFRRELANAALTTSTTFDDFNVLERAHGGAEAAVKIDTTADNRIETLSINYENDFDDDAYSLGSEFIPAGLIGELSCTGSLDARFESIDLYNDWLAETSKQIELESTFGASATLRTIKFDLPTIALDTNNLPTSGFDRYVQTLNYHAEPDSNDDPLIVTVVNAQSNAIFTG